MESSRRAQLTDVERLAELARMGMEELEPTRGGSVWMAQEARREPLEKGFAELLDAPDYTVLVGTIDSVGIGYAVVRCVELGDGSRLGVIEDIFVEAEARGVGVGEAMINEVIEWCEDRDCIGVDAMALPGHRQTKNFFEDSGFTARRLTMHKPLIRSRGTSS